MTKSYLPFFLSACRKIACVKSSGDLGTGRASGILTALYFARAGCLFLRCCSVSPMALLDRTVLQVHGSQDVVSHFTGRRELLALLRTCLHFAG